MMKPVTPLAFGNRRMGKIVSTGAGDRASDAGPRVPVEETVTDYEGATPSLLMA
jgi:hypothetical protein